MAKTRTEYEFTFSVQRLLALLNEAGFEVRAGDVSGFVKIVGTSPSQDVWIEQAHHPAGPYERITGEERRAERQRETVAPGQYL